MKETKQLSRWAIVILLGSLTAFGPLSVDMYLPAFPNISVDLNTNASMVQLSLTTCLIGMAFGQLVFGPLSDIHGRRKPLMFTLIAYGIISIITAFSPNIIVFVILRFFQGFTGAAGIVIARAAASDLYKGSDLTKFMAMLSLISGAAPILAPITGGIVLNYAPWMMIFIILGIIGFTVFASTMLFLPETLPIEKRSEAGMLKVITTFGILLKDKVFVGIAGIQASIMSGMFAYIAGSAFVLQNIYGVTPQQFSFLFGLNGIGIIMGAQVTGRLAGRIKEIVLLRAGLIMSLIGSIILLLTVIFQLNLSFIVIGLLLVVSSVGIVSTTSFSLAMARQGKTAGSASAFLGLLPFVGGALVAPLVGILGDANAWPMIIIITTCVLIAWVLYLLIVHPKMKRSV